VVEQCIWQDFGIQKSDLKHNSELDDLWTGFEIAEGHMIGHVSSVNIQLAVGQHSLL
jgi:hypothetical protein